MRADPHDLEARGRRVNAFLRLGGLAVLVLAFLGVSKSFTTGKNTAPGPTTTSSTPTRAAVVYADADLERVMRTIAPTATYTFGAPDDLAARIAAGARVDVFISASRAAMRTVANTDHCSTPVAFATKPLVSSCTVERAGADPVVAGAYVDELTTITAREALLDAGIEIPATR